MPRNTQNLFPRNSPHNSRPKQNTFLGEMTHHRILRPEHLPFLPHIRDLQHKLLTIASRKQKILVALARQFARNRLNPEILFSYSLCEISIHRFEQVSDEGLE